MAMTEARKKQSSAGISGQRTYIILCGMLFLMLIACTALWNRTKVILPQWGNVPAAPSIGTSAVAGLGDAQAAYRIYGYFLQNLGNTGGNFTALKDYDYALLEKWFFLENALNPRANFVPMLAAYYFGGIEGYPDKTAHVVTYLAAAGKEPYPQKWRWLAQAVYQARYNEKNLDRALALAHELAALEGDMPAWARQLPAFIQLQMGNKQAAYEIMMRMLISGKDTMDPVELNFMRDFICTRVLDKKEAGSEPLCRNDK